jgi:cytochrome c peroxidase
MVRAMKTCTIAIAVLAAAVAGGCKTKDKPSQQQQGSGSGQGTTPVEPPKARPSQQPQLQLPALELPDDPKRAEKIALGHQLFFDKRLSGKSDLSCYSCHLNEDGTGGHDPLAIGSGGKQMTRHAPALWNVGYWKSAGYWDGRAKSLEANIKGAWSGGNMGGAPPEADTDEKKTAALDKRAADLAKQPGYKKLFEAAYGAGDVKADQVNSAIAEYMRTFLCKDTAFDKYAAGDKAALTEQQQRGLDVFLGKGQCNVCHAPPFFSTAMSVDGGAYFNVGIGTKDVPEDKVDPGRKAVTKADADWAAFKPPSLRNITKTPPYFHDGSVAKLEDAVQLMTTGGIANKNKTPLIKDTGLTDAERADLVAFLGGLECGGKLEEPPKLPAK